MSADAGWMHLNRMVRVGHRGVGVRFEPPNTLRAYRRAIDFGMDMIEIDLRITGDGVLVSAHDEDVHAEGPYSSGKGQRLSIGGHSLAELQTVDLGHGERLPTLEEILTLCHDRCAIMIDLKGEGFERELVDMLHRHRFTNVVIPGGGAVSRARIREIDPTLPLSLSLGHEWADRRTEELFTSIDTDAVTWHFTLLDAETVDRLHRQGLKVFAWTVNNEEEIRRLKEAGGDGIISDRADLLTELL